jgi:hypothetical protein
MKKKMKKRLFWYKEEEAFFLSRFEVMNLPLCLFPILFFTLFVSFFVLNQWGG